MSSDPKEFVFPLATIENKRLRLDVFDIPKHGQSFVDGVKDHPDLWKYIAIPRVACVEDIKKWIEESIYTTNSKVLFAIIVKPEQPDGHEAVAGMIGYLNTSDINLVIEIGFVTVLPQFHGTFVAKNAAGLLIEYALDAPPLGLGLRRCAWQAHALNEPSARLAKKLLFTHEGTRRFERIVLPGKPGNGYDASSMSNVLGKPMGNSRDSVILAHYCDEWEEKRPLLEELMNRT